MTKQDDNLISEFMCHATPRVSYLKSWDLLIPVVSKCMGCAEICTDDDADLVGDINHALLNTNRHQTYKAVIEFIKNYNK